MFDLAKRGVPSLQALALYVVLRFCARTPVTADGFIDALALYRRVINPAVDEGAPALRSFMSEHWNEIRGDTGALEADDTLSLVDVADGEPPTSSDRTPWTGPSDKVPPESPEMKKEISDWLETETSPRVFWMLQSLMYPAK